jgi:hypothetical protein
VGYGCDDMSLPGDENPNPQWQRPKEEKPPWSSGSPLGDGADDPPPPQWQQPQPPPPQPEWQQQPQSEWQRQPPPQWQQPQSPSPAQQYPGWVPPPRTPGQAYASMILGIVGLVLCPILPSILALVFGYMARGEIRRAGGQLGGAGIALTGLILGWVGVGLWSLLFLIVVAAGAA